MPNNVKKANLKSATGYKVCLKIKDKYYSFSTGIEYKLGDIQECNKIPEYMNIDGVLIDGFKTDWLDKFYIPEMRGLTGVFKYRKDAISFMKDDFVIIKLTLKNSLYHAISEDKETYLGKTITKIS